MTANYPLSRIHYSEKYTDDDYEYRHVILPKQLLKLIPKGYWNPDGSGCLRLLTDDEWRGIGIQQSLGWEHYAVHGELLTRQPKTLGSDRSTLTVPEPHVLLFRRAKDFGLPPQPVARAKEGGRRK